MELFHSGRIVLTKKERKGERERPRRKGRNKDIEKERNGKER